MTTITLQDNIKLSKTEFSSIYELRFFIYENFWYPEIKEEVEDSWYKIETLILMIKNIQI